MLRSVYRPLGRWARRRFATLDKALTQAEARPALRANPILIFSMGKTGTTSLTESLHRATGRDVMKAHALTRRGIDRRLEKSRRLAIVERPHFLWTTETISRAVRKPDDRHWEIVCGVRDPIALAVSDYFYGRQLQSHRSPAIEPAGGSLDQHRAAIVAGIEALFFDEDWFADELHPITGIDVYAEPFSTEAGHRMYVSGRFRVLLTRYEDLATAAPCAMRAFFALDSPLAIAHQNVGTATDRGSHYQQFLREGTIPTEVVDRVYSTRLAQHLYSDDERAGFRAKWTGATV